MPKPTFVEFVLLDPVSKQPKVRGLRLDLVAGYDRVAVGGAERAAIVLQGDRLAFGGALSTCETVDAVVARIAAAQEGTVAQVSSSDLQTAQSNRAADAAYYQSQQADTTTGGAQTSA